MARYSFYRAEMEFAPELWPTLCEASSVLPEPSRLSASRHTLPAPSLEDYDNSSAGPEWEMIPTTFDYIATDTYFEPEPEPFSVDGLFLAVTTAAAIIVVEALFDRVICQYEQAKT